MKTPIVHVHGPAYANAFARRRLEREIHDCGAFGEAPWLIDYIPGNAHRIDLEAAPSTLSRTARNRVLAAGYAALSDIDAEGDSNASR